MTFTRYFTQAPCAFHALERVPRRSRDGTAEPDADGGHVDGAAVDDVAFVVSGDDGAVLAELVDGPFDRVALLAGLGVERGRAAAFATLAEPGLDLNGGLGDDCLDPAPPQGAADRPAGVCLAGQYPAGPGPGAAPLSAGDLESPHERDEGQGVVALPGAGDLGQRPAPRVGGQVDPGGQPAAGPAQRLPLTRPAGFRAAGRPVLVIRFSPFTSRDAQHGDGQQLRVDVLGRLVPGPGRVQVSADHCRVNVRVGDLGEGL